MNKNFSVVALTATPGSDAKTVQGIIEKLLISHIELRSDESADIQEFSHTKKVDVHVVRLEGELLAVREAFVEVMRGPVKRLEMNRIQTVKDPGCLTKMFVLEKREGFRRNTPEGLDVSWKFIFIFIFIFTSHFCDQHRNAVVAS